MVIVDTGSVDETVALAQAAGARVVHAAWQDDFAAARNAALPHVADGFVLVLDADERLLPGVGGRIRSAVDDRGVDCWMLPLHNAATEDAPPADVVAGRSRIGGVTYLPRLLRRTADLRWEGVVHENPRTWLSSRGRSIRTLAAPIVHYGYATSVVHARDKVGRNQRLLEARCAVEPTSPDPRVYLAKGLMARGRTEEARAELEAAWALARDLAPGQRQRPIIEEMATSMLRILVQAPPDLAVPYVEEALGWGLAHPNVLYLAGIVYERQRALTRAETLYARALAWNGVALLGLLPGLQDKLLPLRLGIVRCQLGRPLEALAALGPARHAHPEDPALTVAAAEARVGLGQPGDALALLQSVMACGASDPFWVAAAAARQLGELGLAQDCEQQALALGSPLEHHRTGAIAAGTAQPVGAA